MMEEDRNWGEFPVPLAGVGRIKVWRTDRSYDSSSVEE